MSFEKQGNMARSLKKALLLKYTIHINFKQEEIVTVQISEAVHRYIARSFGSVSRDSLMCSQVIYRGQELHSGCFTLQTRKRDSQRGKGWFFWNR